MQLEDMQRPALIVEITCSDCGGSCRIIKTFEEGTTEYLSSCCQDQIMVNGRIASWGERMRYYTQQEGERFDPWDNFE